MRLLEYLFSIKNENNYKVIRILGIRIKFKRKIKKILHKNININPTLVNCPSGFELYFNAEYKTTSIIEYNAIDNRNISTVQMLSIALNRVKNKLSRNFKITVVTSDIAFQPDENIWSYSRYKSKNKNITLIPDFFFDKWITVGCYSFDDWTKKIMDNSKKEYEVEGIFWSGNLNMNPVRNKYYEMSKKNPFIICDSVIWDGTNWKNNLESKSNRKITLVEHPKYKYLIDLPCGGYSSRFKALLFSGRPLFKVEDYIEEYFHKDLKPFVHYIPVKNDLSDLEEKINWAEDNYNQALQIAKNAQEYAINNLTFEKAIQYIESLFLEIGSIK